MTWFADLHDGLDSINGDFSRARELLNRASQIWFIGNGGSASIASHMAIDYTKNGGKRAMAFNDAAALTCLANDYGYENAFAEAVAKHVHYVDCLVAISSSGRSPNILNACKRGIEIGCRIITLSGFDADNPLRRYGDVSFYVPSHDYGVVEVTHLAVLHSMVTPQ